MKKISFIALVMVLLLSVSCAGFAENAALQVEKISLMPPVDKWEGPTAYVKIVNTGDVTVAVRDMHTSFKDADGNEVCSEDFGIIYGEILEPGEYTYASISANDAENKEKIKKVTVDVSGDTYIYHGIKRFPCSAEIVKEMNNSYGAKTDYVVTEVTNNSEEELYDMGIIFAALDENGDILYVSGKIYSDMRVNPGEVQAYRSELYDNVQKSITNTGREIKTIDVIAYNDEW